MITIQILNGAISTGRLPKMHGYSEFLTELEKLLEYAVRGELALDECIGVMGNIQFVTGDRLNLVTQNNKGKIWYSLNGKIVDREEAIKILSNFKNKVDSVISAKKAVSKGQNTGKSGSVTAKQLYNKLAKTCSVQADGGLSIFRNVTSGGSDGSWSSSGTILTAYLEGQKIKFVYEEIDHGSTHVSWNDDKTMVKYYPGDITIQALVQLCAKNGKVLK